MDVLVRFEELPWEAPAPGVRVKAVVQGAQRVRLVEFSHGFQEPDWCTSGHAFHVLEGTFTLHLRDRTVRLAAGDVGLIAPGEAHAHMAVLGPDERVRLLLFEVP